MDPVSAAGLGLGAASLFFQLFAGCIEGFTILTTAHSIGKDSANLVTMLDLQELRLTEWARRVGLLTDPPTWDRRINETIASAVLNQLQTLLLDTDKLKSRYKIVLASDRPSQIKPTDMAEHSPRVLGRVVSENMRREILSRSQRLGLRPSFPPRVWWAMVDKSNFEDLVAQVRSYVQELESLLDRIRQDDMSASIESMVRHVIGITQKFDDLSLLKNALESHVGSQTSSSGENRAKSLASEAEIKSLTLVMDQTTRASQHGTSTVSDANFSIRQTMKTQTLNVTQMTDFKLLKGAADTGIAQYEGHSVLVERKMIPSNLTMEDKDIFTERAKDLAFLLGTRKHRGFRSLRCLGIAFHNDASKIEFIFDLPGSYLESPKFLRGLFELSPSVTDRLHLALALTKSLQHFHTAGWLHKNLRSDNVLMFKTRPEIEDLANPILTGFAFSRPDELSAISERQPAKLEHDIYRHPDAMGEPSTRFSADKDLYALGTILVEIGEWRSLQSLIRPLIDIRNADMVSRKKLSDIKPFLINKKLPNLEFHMGTVYTRVTRMLLSGELPSSRAEPQTRDSDKDFDVDGGSSVMFEPDILEIAVRELGRCVI